MEIVFKKAPLRGGGGGGGGGGSTTPVRNIDMNYSQGISKWKLYQNFLNISLISSPHSSEFMCLSIEKDTDAMNLQRPDLNPKPSYSTSRSIGRGGTSVHDVLIDHCYTTTPGFCHHRINC